MKFTAAFYLISICLLVSCSDNQKNNRSRTLTRTTEVTSVDFNKIPSNASNIASQPKNILLTRYPNIRITPVFQMLKNNYTNGFYSGFPDYHCSYQATGLIDNNWNDNLIPGFRAVYGQKMVNVHIYNLESKKQKALFNTPLLINTLYYPTETSDTLMGKHILRDYIMVSAYDEDTNNDSFINDMDLRRLYLFDMAGNRISELIPKNINVLKSEYDHINDYLYVFARKDLNSNGKSEDLEPMVIYWINLSKPTERGEFYKQI